MPKRERESERCRGAIPCTIALVKERASERGCSEVVRLWTSLPLGWQALSLYPPVPGSSILLLGCVTYDFARVQRDPFVPVRGHQGMCISSGTWSQTRAIARFDSGPPGSIRPGLDEPSPTASTTGPRLSRLRCWSSTGSWQYEQYGQYGVQRYTGNPNCTAVPNYHLPYLGAAHQDEVTFVLGQPNFMEDGSCCGLWGLTTPDCPHLTRCEACYAPNRFGHEGYRAYFNDKEYPDGT